MLRVLLSYKSGFFQVLNLSRSLKFVGDRQSFEDSDKCVNLVKISCKARFLWNFLSMCNMESITFCIFLQLAPVGTTVYRGVSAQDLDLNENKDRKFAIVPGNGGPVGVTLMSQKFLNHCLVKGCFFPELSITHSPFPLSSFFFLLIWLSIVFSYEIWHILIIWLLFEKLCKRQTINQYCLISFMCIFLDITCKYGDTVKHVTLEFKLYSN